MTPHEGDANASDAWLHKLTAPEWLKAASAELARAQQALAQHDTTRATAGLKRAAGMACNAALVVVPNPAWGRTYVEHLTALAEDRSAPQAVQSAAQLLGGLGPSRAGVVTLGTPSQSEQWLEAARTVMAHAYAIVYGSVGRPP